MKSLYISHIKIRLRKPKTILFIEQEKYPVLLHEDGSIDDCDKQRVIRSMFREKMKQTNQVKKAESLKDYKIDFKIISSTFSSKIYE